MAKAAFGAGCFWGVESAFRQVKGVTDAAVGYMGGSLANPTYDDVCTDRTGHAEVVQLDYDPASRKLRGTAARFLRSTRSHIPQPPGPRLRQAISLGDFLLRCGPAARGAKNEGRSRSLGPIPSQNRDPDRTRAGILARRGVPSALFRETRHCGLRNALMRRPRLVSLNLGTVSFSGSFR